MNEQRVHHTLPLNDVFTVAAKHGESLDTSLGKLGDNV